MPSTKNLYYSGYSGGFGIPSSAVTDSLIFVKDGYDTVRIRFNTSSYLRVVLRKTNKKNLPVVQKMTSFTIGADEDQSRISTYNGETYSRLIENDFVRSGKSAQTTFGLRIDKASYSNIRRFINMGMEVPPDAVRIEEMLNYFNLNYQQPEGSQTFGFSSQVTDCPWNPAHKLLIASLSAQKLDLSKVPPSNFVFLIDISGSMDAPQRLPLLKEAFQLLIKNLRPVDTVSIVTYGGSVGIWLQPTSGAQKSIIAKAIEELYASGDTPGEAAIRTAYDLARSTFIKGGNNRIILATDGDFNVGMKNEKSLEDLIVKEKESGVTLTCLGVGMGNYKDSKIEVLAQKGNGNFAYIDDLAEAEKVLVLQFTQTMYAVAKDAYISVKFNPDAVAQYRLIGFDNKISETKNFIGEPVGGVIGSGAENTIIFELVPPKPDSLLMSTSIAEFKLHYQSATDTAQKEYIFSSNYNYLSFSQLPKQSKFAVSVALLGLKLKKSQYLPDISWKTIAKLAEEAAQPDDILQVQFVELIRKCEKNYLGKGRRKRF